MYLVGLKDCENYLHGRQAYHAYEFW